MNLMHVPKPPPNESERLRALESYQILDTEAEMQFDDIVKLAAFICGTPIALITLLDQERQWFKAKVGVDELSQTSRDIAFCGQVVYDGQPFTVEAADKDERFADNPLVTEMGVRFYAGLPLKDENGFTLGSLCVLDKTPRHLTPEQNTAMEALSRQVMDQIKFRREAIAQARLAKELADSQSLMKRYFSRPDVWMGIIEFDGKTILQILNNPRTETYFTDRGLDPMSVNEADDHVPARAEWFHAYAECARTRKMQSFDFESAPDGETRILRATINYVGQSERDLPQMSFMVDDVTAHRQGERLLEQQRQMVVHSSKLSALGEMAAGMAHEINNPLAIIGGRAQELRMLLERGASEARLKESLASIDRTVERISKIIRGLRSFARDAGQDPMVPTNVVEVLNDTLSFCTARFQAHGVRLEVQSPGGDLQIVCRSAEISQVFLNLLNNAHDAALDRENARWVRVDIEASADAIEILFTDSGPGIAKELREKIMQPFFTTKPVNQGTGLGLSIAKGIVEAHGGTIHLDQTAEDTRFVVRLPRAAKRNHVA